MHAGEEVLVEHKAHLGIITLNRPNARNALNSALLSALLAALNELAADDNVGCIVLTGNGPSFCAGADLKEAAEGMEGGDFWASYERVNRSMLIHKLLPQLPKPVIAAVNGHAVAGGCGLAMSCDIVFASERAVFGYPEVGRGLVAAMVMVSLSRILGRRQALELLLSGRTFGADEALRLGMINRVLPHADRLPRVLEYAADLASRSASALRVTKELFRQVQETDYDRALDYARDVNVMFRQTRDARAGANAFATSPRQPEAC